MKDELPILDAEFVDVPSASVKPSKIYKAKVSKPKQAKKPKTPEGRIDILTTGLLTQSYANMTGAPVPDPIAKSIKQAVEMLVGKQRAKGPEWDFIKGIIGD